MNKWLVTLGLVGSASQLMAATDTTAPVVTASVASGTYTSAQKVSLTVKDNIDTAPKIYYTKDGTLPTTASSLYKAGQSFTVVDKGVARDFYLRLLTVDKSGNSRRQTFTYNIDSAPVVTPNKAAGTYTGTQSITLSAKDDTDKAPVIYYTTDGSAPNRTSTVYQSGTVISAKATSAAVDLPLRTLAMDSQGNWRRQIFNYVINDTDTTAPLAVASVVAGTYTAPQSVTLTITDDKDTAPKAYYTLDGTEPTASSAAYTKGAAISIKSTATLKVLVVDATGNKKVYSFAYVISEADTTAPVAAASLAAGSYTGTQSVTLTLSDNKDSAPKAYYTLDGSEPTASSASYTTGAAISITATSTLKVLVVDASGNKQVYSFAYVIVPVSTDKWYFRGTPNNWGTTLMAQEGSLFCTVQAFGAASTDPRFKVDHKGDWTENYPSQDYKVTADTTYKICFNPTSKALTATAQEGADTKAPVVSATPSAGAYTDTQSIKLAITDNKDTAPKLYYTIDGSEPTTGSALYKGETLTAKDVASKGADLTIRTLAVDADGNKATNSFIYYIGASTTAGRDFREESIYFLMTARFYDGDPSNNRYGRADKDAGNVANNDPSWRGDIEGLIKKLDYIKALGFTAVWITPPVLNRSDLDFHGYHAWDMTKIDGRLGGDEAFKRLIAELHKRNMKLVMDIVLNHTSRYGEVNLQKVRYFGIQDPMWSWYYDTENPSFVYDGVSIEPNSGKNYYNGDLWTSEKPTLAWSSLPNWGTKSSFNNQTQRWNYNYQWPDLTLFNPEYYHKTWLKNWEDETAQNSTIHEDLPDLNTESAKVQEYLIKTYCHYIEMGVDAFRIDTVKHINRLMFNRHFVPGFKACGGDDFYMFGEVATRVNEVWNKGVAPLSTPFYTWAERRSYSADDTTAVHEAYDWENGQGVNNQPTSNNHHLNGNTYHTPDYSNASGLSVIDFPMHWNFSDANSAINISNQDSVYNDATWNVVYVDSHDYGPNTDNRYAGGTDAWAENMSYMWTFRGIPTLYYGSEIEFKKGARADLGGSAPLENTGRAYYGANIEGDVTVKDFGVWSNATGAMATTLNSPLAKHLSRLNQIRRAIPALQKGQYSRDDISGNNLAYKRRYTNAAKNIDSFALIAVSGGATFNNIPNGTYTDAVTGDVKTVSNGTLSMSFSGKGNMRVYVLSLPNNPAPGKIGEAGPYLK